MREARAATSSRRSLLKYLLLVLVLNRRGLLDLDIVTAGTTLALKVALDAAWRRPRRRGPAGRRRCTASRLALLVHAVMSRPRRAAPTPLSSRLRFVVFHTERSAPTRRWWWRPPGRALLAAFAFAELNGLVHPHHVPGITARSPLAHRRLGGDRLRRPNMLVSSRAATDTSSASCRTAASAGGRSARRAERANEALAAKASALEEKQSELKTFVYTVTHDLKKPVNAMLLTVDWCSSAEARPSVRAAGPTSAGVGPRACRAHDPRLLGIFRIVSAPEPRAGGARRAGRAGAHAAPSADRRKGVRVAAGRCRACTRSRRAGPRGGQPAEQRRQVRPCRRGR